MPDQKVCAVCGESKPAQHPEFDRSSRHLDGLSSRCADCRRAQGRARYARNREALVAHQRAYRAAHPDRSAAYSKRWRERNPETVKKYFTARRVERARGRGSLIAPERCEQCGTSGTRILAAVGSYAEPLLTIRWLCRRCTRNWTPEQRAAYAAAVLGGRHA